MFWNLPSVCPMLPSFLSNARIQLLRNILCHSIDFKCLGADVRPTHMQRIDALCSDIWSEHGDAIGTYAPYLLYIVLVQRCTYDKHTHSAPTPLSPLTISICSIRVRILSFHLFTCLQSEQ